MVTPIGFRNMYSGNVEIRELKGYMIWKVAVELRKSVTILLLTAVMIVSTIQKAA